MFPSNPWKDVSNEGIKESLIKLFYYHFLSIKFYQKFIRN
jgi:hypothetical protein